MERDLMLDVTLTTHNLHKSARAWRIIEIEMELEWNGT